jgi:S1-C subfamily serine protease
MRVATYMKYMGFAAAVFGLTSGVARPQEQRATTKSSTVQADQDCSSSVFDSAELQRELARAQREWRQSLVDMQGRARQVQREVAQAMAERGIQREEMTNLAAQLRSERPALEAQARIASQEAQQLFAQAPLIVSDEDTGWLGMEMTEVTPEKAKELKVSPIRGVIVTEVLPDGPAAKAGLQKDDVVVQYDGQTVEGTVQLRRLVRETPPGRSVNVTVMRGGQEKRVSIQVGNSARNMGIELRQMEPLRDFNFKFDMPEVFAGMTPVLGIEAEEVSGQLGQYFRVPGDEGVLVREVSPGTAAAQAGLKAGDVITKVDGVEVRTVDELRRELREKREKKSVPLIVVRNGSQVTINVTLEQPKLEPETRVRSAAL